MVQSKATKNALHELGYKIFLDRYAQKDMTRSTLEVGDTVIVVVNSQTGQREVGEITKIALPKVSIKLLDGETVIRDLEHVDKPIETQPEQMMERVARGVAETEKSKKKQDEWSRKFRWLLDDWKFVPGGRILTAAGTDQDLTFYNCMPPEQEILTKDGYMPIAEVQVGDYVVTHRNRLRKVLHKFERETEEDIYIIKPLKLGFDDLRVTGDHKILVIRSKWANIKHMSRDGLRLKQEPQWIPAKDIRKGDFVAAAYNGDINPSQFIKISDYIGMDALIEDSVYPEYSILSEHSAYEVEDEKLVKVSHYANGKKMVGKRPLPLNNDLELDADLCYLFGRWLGDGCITHRTGTAIPSGIKIVFNLKEIDDAHEIAEIFERKFGIAADIKLSSTERWYDLWVNSMPVGEFFKSLLGHYSYAKVIPSVLMNLTDDLAIALLRGLFKADGYLSKNQIGMMLSNRTMATQAHSLLMRLGYFFSIKENTHELGTVPAYRVTGTVSECADLFEKFFDTEAPEIEVNVKYHLEYDDLRWVRIQEIETENYKGQVLDIEVEEDHSFVSAGVVVSNCYVIPSPNDSREGIMTTLTQMTEIMSRGGGVGINISTLRPRHAYVKGVNGRSSGSVSWGALYSFVTGLIEQGGSRRGALMLILNDWHPDVFDFINSKRQAGQITNANISVGVSDKLMEAVKNDEDWDLIFPDTNDPDYDELWDGDLNTWVASGRNVLHYKTIKARELWDAIIQSAWASAEPGVWFNERSNKMANSWYFNPLISTNPCIAGDMRIHTDEGLVTARELFDEETEISVAIDGRFGLEQHLTPATRVFMTGIKPVFRLQTKEGYYLRATADHKIMTSRGWVELQDLNEGDKIHILNRKGGFGREGSERLGRILGWLVGDGTVKADRAVLSFFGDEKKELAPMFAEYVNDIVEPLGVNANRTYTVGVVDIKGRDEARVQSERLLTLVEGYGLVENKHQVPDIVFKGTEAMQRGFLQALFTADGSVQYFKEKKVASIRLACNNMNILEGVQMLLSNFGIASRTYQERRKAGYRKLPDGKGGLKKYWCEAQHELVISRANMTTFRDEIGFILTRKNDQLNDILGDYIQGPRSESFIAKVESITEDGYEEVFDLTEPLSHSFVSQSLIIANCGEQPLGAFSVCNLGAINLSRFYEPEKQDVNWDELKQTVQYATRFLDNVIDTTPYFFKENEVVQMDERRVGLGTMGIAELMLRMGIRYGSEESVEFIDKVYKLITVTAYETSSEIAKEKGAFPKFEAEKFLESGFMLGMPEDLREKIRQDGIRNVTLLTQAPTGTTGTMVNTSTGVEPFFSWVYYRKSRLGLHEEKVPIVKEWYDDNPDAVELPDYFATAMDLDPAAHVKVQGAFQRWIDSAISKTCNVPNDYTVEQVSELYKYMYELGCKGGTIYRDGSRDEQVLMLKGDERAESEMKDIKGEDKSAKSIAPATPHRVYPRPDRLQGTTVRTQTPFGKAYITINKDENDYPFEVFITIGKVGSDIQADADGLGRMISLQLRTTAPHNRNDMLKLIIEQLQDIGGARPIGFGPKRVLSLPDAVASVLYDEFFKEDQPQQLGLPMNGDDDHKAVEQQQPAPTTNVVMNSSLSGADMCPDCGTITLIRTEGCRKCLTCGYSEC